MFRRGIKDWRRIICHFRYPLRKMWRRVITEGQPRRFSSIRMTRFEVRFANVIWGEKKSCQMNSPSSSFFLPITNAMKILFPFYIWWFVIPFRSGSKRNGVPSSFLSKFSLIWISNSLFPSPWYSFLFVSVYTESVRARDTRSEFGEPIQQLTWPNLILYWIRSWGKI
jgi:hypothetical protein